MKKRNSIIVAVIIVIILAVGAFAYLYRYMPSKTTSTTTTSQANVPAVNNSVLNTKTDTALGQYLTDPSGKPLYTYNADSAAKSNCTGSCLANWPAYQATGSITNLPDGVATITRTDNNQTQYTYKGKPLYYFVSDSQGHVTGDGIENFSVAKPAATTTPQATPSTQPSSQPTY
jgi:predicted lipoprotein with Yx(FWY)xxD motif